MEVEGHARGSRRVAVAKRSPPHRSRGWEVPSFANRSCTGGAHQPEESIVHGVFAP
jgi:hypothetical protein